MINKSSFQKIELKIKVFSVEISEIRLSIRVVRSIVHLGRYFFSHLNESKHIQNPIILSTFIPFVSLLHDYHQHPSTLIRIIDSYCKNPIYTYSRDVLSFFFFLFFFFQDSNSTSPLNFTLNSFILILLAIFLIFLFLKKASFFFLFKL